MASDSSTTPHPGEAHLQNVGQRLNWLRAGVLGANDGIVSTTGVAAATPNNVLAIARANIAAYAEVELGIDHEEYTSPWAAAVSSFIAFAVGAPRGRAILRNVVMGSATMIPPRAQSKTAPDRMIRSRFAFGGAQDPSNSALA